MRVVICDDHRLLLEALTTALAGQGYVVEAATTSPEDAVRAVSLADPDVLLMDVMFPDGSGVDTARRVMAEHPRTKVVLMTGTESVEPLTEALQIGVSGYVMKGQRIEAIVEALETAVRGGLSVDRQLLGRVRNAAPVPRQRTPLDQLTPREKYVFTLLANGMSTRQIVQRLGVSQSTVRTHIQNILSKLGVHTRLQAVAVLTAEHPATGPEHARAYAD